MLVFPKVEGLWGRGSWGEKRENGVGIATYAHIPQMSQQVTQGGCPDGSWPLTISPPSQRCAEKKMIKYTLR